MTFRYTFCAAIAVAAAVPAIAEPVQITNQVMSEKHIAASDGTTRIELVPAARVTPGDKLVYQITYGNTGSQPVSDFVVSNPIPKGVAYLAVDGTTFGSLAALRVKDPNGALRPADASDVKAVRWRLTQPLAAGSHGQFAYEAMLK